MYAIYSVKLHELGNSLISVVNTILPKLKFTFGGGLVSSPIAYLLLKYSISYNY